MVLLVQLDRVVLVSGRVEVAQAEVAAVADAERSSEAGDRDWVELGHE